MAEIEVNVTGTRQRQANLMRLHLVEADARRLLARLHAVIDTLL